MIALVTGGRTFSDRAFVDATLDLLHDEHTIALLVHGGCSGADKLADAWACAHDVLCHIYEADWRRHRRAAGPLRNTLMLDREKPDLVIAFPGGRGTADLVRKAEQRGILVWHAADRQNHPSPRKRIFP